MSQDQSERDPSRLTYHVPALLDQEIPKSLDDALQDFPSNAMARLGRYDMYCRAIAQIIVYAGFEVSMASYTSELSTGQGARGVLFSKPPPHDSSLVTQ